MKSATPKFAGIAYRGIFTQKLAQPHARLQRSKEEESAMNREDYEVPMNEALEILAEI